jgi:hypothetical protein
MGGRRRPDLDVVTVRAELLPDAVTIVRPGVSHDRYGNAVPDWTGATRTAVSGRLVPRAAPPEVNTPGRVAVETDWSLILPAGTPIDATCRVEVAGGATYSVDGDPIQRRTMRTVHHVTATLKAMS